MQLDQRLVAGMAIEQRDVPLIESKKVELADPDETPVSCVKLILREVFLSSSSFQEVVDQ